MAFKVLFLDEVTSTAGLLNSNYIYTFSTALPLTNYPLTHIMFPSVPTNNMLNVEYSTTESANDFVAMESYNTQITFPSTRSYLMPLDPSQPTIRRIRWYNHEFEP